MPPSPISSRTKYGPMRSGWRSSRTAAITFANAALGYGSPIGGVGALASVALLLGDGTSITTWDPAGLRQKVQARRPKIHARHGGSNASSRVDERSQGLCVCFSNYSCGAVAALGAFSH